MPAESTYAPFEVPKQDIFGFLFDNKERTFPNDKVLFRDPDTGRHYTYSSLKDASIEFGTGLRAVWDWEKGDVLALFSPNCIDTPAIMFGTLWAGGILSPANPAYTAEEFAFQLKDSKARAIATQKDFLPTAIKAAEMAGIDKEMICLIGDQRTTDGSFKHFTSVRNISRATRYRKVKVADTSKTIAFLVYSSGTTGLPKGVMLTHMNITSNIRQIQAGESGNLTWENDKILAFLPFYHIYGLTCLIMQSCHRGFETVVMSKFEIERFCQIVQDMKITFIYMVPPIVLLLAKHPIVDKYNLSSIRMVNSGAAPLTKELIEQVNKRIPLPIKQGYGLSETSPTTHTLNWEDWDKIYGSVGKLLPNLSTKYLDESGKEVPMGQVGEICLKGPNVFLGYLNKPDLTKLSFTDDGYFKTGDIGYQDEDGNLFITDRVKELIKYKGFQVAPAELEGILLDSPLVDDAAVIGLQDEEQATELPRAYIVTKTGVEKSDATKKKIADYLHAKVAQHKKLRGGVYFVDEIPKSASGKILRRVLRDKAIEESKKPKAKL